MRKKDVVRKTLLERRSGKDVVRKTLCRKTLWERKKKHWEKDVPLMDSIYLLIECPMCFFFSILNYFWRSGGLDQFHWSARWWYFSRHILSNFWAYTMSDMQITGCVKARLKMALFQIIMFIRCASELYNILSNTSISTYTL